MVLALQLKVGKQCSVHSLKKVPQICLQPSNLLARDDNMGQPGPFRPGPHKARTSQTGPPRSHNLCGCNHWSVPHITWPAGLRAGPLFFIIFMIKLSMFKN